jgi:coenzyme PQQ precursor peptide PqqA
LQGLRGTSERLWRLRRLQRLRSKSVERLRRVWRLRSTSLERLWRLRRLRRLRLRHLPDMDRPGLGLGLLAVASWGQSSGPRRSGQPTGSPLAPRENPIYLVRVASPAGTRLVASQGKRPMAWTTPALVEICIGLEINGYLPAEF